jgi:hypothetical protein
MAVADLEAFNYVGGEWRRSQSPYHPRKRENLRGVTAELQKNSFLDCMIKVAIVSSSIPTRMS